MWELSLHAEIPNPSLHQAVGRQRRVHVEVELGGALQVELVIDLARGAFGRVAAGELQGPEAGVHGLGRRPEVSRRVLRFGAGELEEPLLRRGDEVRHQDQREEQSEQRDSESGFRSHLMTPER
jgi:hypothetical protein